MEAFAGRIVLVAGASGGIGLAVARQFAEAGAQVIVHGRTAESAGKAAARLAGECPAGQFTPLHANLIDHDEAAAMFAAIQAQFGQLHAMINCVEDRSIPSVSGRFRGVNPVDAANRAANVYRSLFHLCHYALPLLEAAGGGSIVTYGSDAGKVARPGQTIVGCTMAGIMMFTRTLALEFAEQQVRVNCISPTYVVDTPIYEMVQARGAENRADNAAKRAKLGLPTPDDLASLTVYLCGDQAAHLTGQVISVNGGLTAA
jgi:NAD(P)-dependent dehydrogenase (short-subunit alcohol dehydrogenase family)